MDSNTFTCAICGGTFIKAWTDEEAQKELQEMFGDVSPDDCDVVCDDCYRALKQG